MIALRKSQFVGKSTPRIDDCAKLSGASQFVADLRFDEPLLHAVIVPATAPAARLRQIDASAALALPGVAGVITHHDLPVRGSAAMPDRAVLAAAEVRFVGEPVAVVAAETLALAQQAAAMVKITYSDEQGAVCDMAAALSSQAQAIHPGGNVACQFVRQQGDPDQGWQQAEVVIEASYRTARLQHTPIEPHAAIARAEADGRVTLWASTQAPARLQHGIAQALGLEPERLRVVAPCVGGGFGSKAAPSIEALTVAMALHLPGRAIKLALDRRSEFLSTFTRPGLAAHLRLGATRAGELVALAATYDWEIGASAAAAAGMIWLAAQAGSGPYRIPHQRLISRGIYTNHPPAAPMRGNGMAEISWAVEQHIERLAVALQIDPVDLRLRNLIKGGDALGAGRVMHATGLEQCLRKVEQALTGSKSAAANPTGKAPHLRRGRSMAVMWSPVLYTPRAQGHAVVTLDAEHLAQVTIDGVDAGQGFTTVAAQLAAAELGVPLEWVRVGWVSADQDAALGQNANTDLTWRLGNAVIQAAQAARAQLLQRAAALWAEPAAHLDLVEGEIISHATERTQPLLQFLAITDSSGPAERALRGEGAFAPQPSPSEDMESPFTIAHYSTGAQGVEVEVDVETGAIEVLRLISAVDVGHALNPDLVEAQIKGGAIQGLSMALLEQMHYCAGLPQNPSLRDYRIATIRDLPQTLEVIMVQTPQRDGPYGARGVGEHTAILPAAAIANALFHATGVWFTQLPLSSENVWSTLQANRKDPAPALAAVKVRTSASSRQET